MRAAMARYLAFEGGEGSGKSTQAARLAARLDAVLTREPGGTTVGERLRAVLLEAGGVGEGIDERTEALLMMADRAQHLAEVVLPALDAGRDVVSDRSGYSTLAYQGYGRGLRVDELRGLCDWACFGRWPDLVILVDVPLEVGLARVGADRDRFERAEDGFHQRVRDGFLALAAAEAHRWLVVDGTASPDEVERTIVEELNDRLG
jgi:dTMP kinase